MHSHSRYSAQIHQNNKIVVSYYSDDLFTVKNMLKSLVTRELSSIEGKIIDKDLNKIIFSMNSNS